VLCLKIVTMRMCCGSHSVKTVEYYICELHVPDFHSNKTFIRKTYPIIGMKCRELTVVNLKLYRMHRLKKVQ
jgi:hypothetical protein